MNNDGTSNRALRPLSGPLSFFRRARGLVGGAIVDDVDCYNRVHEMLHILTSEANRDNDELEGFGPRWDNDEFWGKWNGNTNFGEIPPNGSKSVTFKPLFGLFNQPKYIPLMWSPLTLELEVVNGATGPLVGRNASADYKDTNTSITWQLRDVRLRPRNAGLSSAELLRRACAVR